MPHAKMTFREYLALEGVNFSRMKKLLESPLAYRANVDRDADTLRIGRALHSLVLGGDDVVAYDGIRRGKEWADFVSAHGQSIILKRDAYDDVISMSNAIVDHPIAGDIIRRGVRHEHVLTWQDARTGLACKAMIDLETDTRELVDVKSAVSVARQAFGRAAAGYGYHRQLAWYARGYAEVFGDWPDRCLLVVAGKSAPWDVGVYEVEYETIRGEQAWLDERLAEVAACTRSGIWPGATPEIVPLEIPVWAMTGGDDPGPVIGGGDDE